MPERVSARRRVTTIEDGAARVRLDHLAAEVPMEVRVDGEPIAVTMRTPGHDFELAVGFCLTEGLLEHHDDVQGVRYCAGPGGPGEHGPPAWPGGAGDHGRPARVDEAGRNTYNVVDVARRGGLPALTHLRRNVYTSSSCGICGTASLEAVRRRVSGVHDDDVRFPAQRLTRLPAVLREAQSVFERTGGLHAAGLFDSTGELVCLREDVGRHNAVDKVIGWAALAQRLPLTGHVLMVSGRVAFEIVQKAVVARVPIVAAISAPSSLAVELAVETGMTLVGFLRGSRMNVYAGVERVA